MMKTNQIPKTDSIEELAQFWDKHDLTEFESELEEITEPVFRRSSADVVQVQLSRPDMERLKRLASQQGIGYAALIQRWVQEKLQAA
jgi:predicted DNA binding CopG/RHH family protein